VTCSCPARQRRPGAFLGVTHGPSQPPVLMVWGHGRTGQGSSGSGTHRRGKDGAATSWLGSWLLLQTRPRGGGGLQGLVDRGGVARAPGAWRPLLITSSVIMCVLPTCRPLHSSGSAPPPGKRTRFCRTNARCSGTFVSGQRKEHDMPVMSPCSHSQASLLLQLPR
jgi:hypothetical protein